LCKRGTPALARCYRDGRLGNWPARHVSACETCHFVAIIDGLPKSAYMANNLNRRMGPADLYPFTLIKAV
jgi:hypothetical protein